MLGQLSLTKEDLLRHLKALLEASNRKAFSEESPEFTEPATSSQFLTGATQKPKLKSLKANEATIQILQEELHTMASLKAHTTKVDTQQQQLSLENKKLKEKLEYLQKLLKSKDIFMNAENRHLCSLNKTLAEKEKESNTLRQTVRKLSLHDGHHYPGDGRRPETFRDQGSGGETTRVRETSERERACSESQNSTVTHHGGHSCPERGGEHHFETICDHIRSSVPSKY